MRSAASTEALGLAGKEHGKLNVKAQGVCDLALDLDHAASRKSLRACRMTVARARGPRNASSAEGGVGRG